MYDASCSLSVILLLSLLLFVCDAILLASHLPQECCFFDSLFFCPHVIDLTRRSEEDLRKEESFRERNWVPS